MMHKSTRGEIKLHHFVYNFFRHVLFMFVSIEINGFFKVDLHENGSCNFRKCSVGGVKYANKKSKRTMDFYARKMLEHLASNSMVKI